MAEILDSKKIKYFCEDKYSFITSRKGKIGEFLFIKNISMSEFSKIHIGNAGKEYKKLDLIDFKVETINDEIMIEPSGSIILIKDSDISETLHEDYEINAYGKSHFDEREILQDLYKKYYERKCMNNED